MNQITPGGMVIHNFDKALQNALVCGDILQGEQQIDHYHTDDLYGRRCRIPKGTVGATRVHKVDHLAMCLAGELILVDQEGNRTYVKAPAVLVTKAGTHRAVLALTDVDWVTVHHTDHKDVDTIEDVLTCASMEEYNNLLTFGV